MPAAIELRRGQWQLAALARGAQLPGSLHVKPLALAPGARERAIDIDVDAKISALGADLVGRDHVVHQRLDEGGLIEIEKDVSGHRRCGGRLLGLRIFRRHNRCGPACCRGAADNGGLEKIAPVELLFFFFHGRPLPPETNPRSYFCEPACGF